MCVTGASGAVGTGCRQKNRFPAPGVNNDVLPWLAHELWHAVEIAGAPDVRDRVRLLRFYARIPGGYRTSGTAKAEVVETLKAQKIRATVLDELRGF